MDWILNQSLVDLGVRDSCNRSGQTEWIHKLTCLQLFQLKEGDEKWGVN